MAQPCGIPYQQVNGVPHGYTRLSAAGVAYFVAKALDEENVDLAKIAIVGNVGDMMARETLGLVGPAAEIVADGVAHGSVRVVRRDLNCYGTSTRPVHVCLSYNDDPRIPGITNDMRGALRFLRNSTLDTQAPGGRWLVWEELDLTREDGPSPRPSFSSSSRTARAWSRVFAESYLFPDEPGALPAQERLRVRDPAQCLRPVGQARDRLR